MALKSDNQGFLVGEPVDIGRAVDQLRAIRSDVSAIKRALLGTPNIGGKASKNTAIDQAVKIATPSSPRSRDNKPAGKAATPTRSDSGTRTPGTAQAAAKGAVTGNDRAKPTSIATPKSRSASGQFTRKTEADAGRDKTTGRFTSNGGDDDDRRSKGILNNFVDRIATVATDATAGAEEADPTIKAFQEVAEPMKRGYQTLFGGGEKGKNERWYKKIFKELNLFRKDETAFNKAQNKVLKNIEGKPSGGEDSSGFIGGLLGRIAPMVLAAIAGIGGALLAGIGTVLGVIFSPIGLAIGAAATIAWGLFTENGQKFFGEVGAKIIAGWDTVVTAFAPITESISKGWDTVKSGFDDLINGMSSTWDAFTGFLKDKFGIDIPAILKPVVDAGKKALDAAKETVNVGADKAVEAVKKSSPKTTEALGNLWGSAKEGAENISRRAKFNEVDAALNFQGGDQITGLNDAQTRALAANTAKTESAGKVDSDNKQGYFGQYQFGAEALIESGLVKQDKLEDAKKASGKNWYKKRNSKGEMGGHEAFLRDKSNWKVEGGLDAFLQDKVLQDQAFIKYTNKNVAGGLRSGAISKGDSAEKIAGYSKAAHLKGVGGANKLFKSGVESTDGNGTSTATYAKQAAAAMSSTVAAINANNMPPYNGLGVGHGASSQTQTAFAAAPKVPTFTPAPTPAEAPPQVTPLASLNTERNVTVTMPSADVGQDIKDRGIAHIATGGLSGRG